jgi:8-oxo-dGTP pyrophosphatase MutT (NUDIX family)
MGFLRHIEHCNLPVTEPFIPWLMDDHVVGWLRPGFAEKLRAWPQIFGVQDDKVFLNDELVDFDSRSRALRQVVDDLASQGACHPAMDEPYPVTPGGMDDALCVVDRVVASHFGVRSFGQHLNGYTIKDGEMMMWIGRRARDRLVFPGKLDQMVAGGLPFGIRLEENLVKECWEEASVPRELAEKSRPVGAVTYSRVSERGYRPDVLYCYDLELPADFVPQNSDGEVEEFMLLSIDEVTRLVLETEEFKLNCNLIIIDFLIRHGFVTPHHPEYVDLVAGLTMPLGAPKG